jgi:hypothetical protein
MFRAASAHHQEVQIVLIKRNILTIKQNTSGSRTYQHPGISSWKQTIQFIPKMYVATTVQYSTVQPQCSCMKRIAGQSEDINGTSVISDKVYRCKFLRFCSGGVEISILPGYGAVQMGNWCPTRRERVMVSFSKIETPDEKLLQLDFQLLKTRTVCCLETSGTAHPLMRCHIHEEGRP